MSVQTFLSSSVKTATVQIYTEKPPKLPQMASLGKWLSFEHVWYVYLRPPYVPFRAPGRVCVRACAHRSHRLEPFLWHLWRFVPKLRTASPSQFVSVCLPSCRENNPGWKELWSCLTESRSSRKVNCCSRRGGERTCRKVLSYFRSLSLQSFSFFFLPLNCVSVENKFLLQDSFALHGWCRDCTSDISVTQQSL